MNKAYSRVRRSIEEADLRSLYSCVADQHDLRLVLLAVLICVAGVYATFSLGSYAHFAPNRRKRWIWEGACIVSASCAVWTTHFIAMLAFHPGAPVGFQPQLTAASLLIAVAVMGVGIVATLSAGAIIARAVAGALVGLGISAMHYLGMAAYEIPGKVSWEPMTVAASVALSIAFAACSALLSLSAPTSLRQRLAPLCLVLAVCSLHFTGMAAVTVAYDPTKALPVNAVQPNLLSIAVAAAATVVLGLASASLWLDQASRKRRRAERERLTNLADVALEGLLICRGDLVVSANESIRRLCGSTDRPLVGLSLNQIVDGKFASGVSDLFEEEASLLAEDGTIPVRVLRRSIVVNRRPHAVIAVRDQRERLRTEAQIRDLAFSDSLTGLPNRAQFQRHLEWHAGLLRPGQSGFAVLIVDLDRFKAVNDTLGHPVGDLLLQRAAARLKAATRDGDMVARLGGDEFAILQPNALAPALLPALAARIVDLFARPFLLNGHVINIGASVGVARAPTDGTSPDELLRNADLALYKAKADGRGSFRLFETDLDAQMQARRAMELDLRRAVARQDFELHYQPLVDAKSGLVMGAEALVRWRDSERGLVPPSEFIPVAEETGLISALGQWVLRTACEEAASWPGNLTVAVNLSPVQFRDPGLPETVRGILHGTGLAANRLELEVTEGVLIADEERTFTTLNTLRAIGVGISLDDFGTGYSSLNYLRRFPFDKIKIDKSFIREVPQDLESSAIVKAIVALGACLGMTITVEGVERLEQLDFVADEGCDRVQGYFLSPPLPADVFARFIDCREAA